MTVSPVTTPRNAEIHIQTAERPVVIALGLELVELAGVGYVPSILPSGVRAVHAEVVAGDA